MVNLQMNVEPLVVLGRNMLGDLANLPKQTQKSSTTF